MKSCVCTASVWYAMSLKTTYSTVVEKTLTASDQPRLVNLYLNAPRADMTERLTSLIFAHQTGAGFSSRSIFFDIRGRKELAAMNGFLIAWDVISSQSLPLSSGPCCQFWTSCPRNAFYSSGTNIQQSHLPLIPIEQNYPAGTGGSTKLQFLSFESACECECEENEAARLSFPPLGCGPVDKSHLPFAR